MGSNTAGVGKVGTVLAQTVRRGTGVVIPTVPVRPATKGATSSNRRFITSSEMLIPNDMTNLEGLGKHVVESEMLIFS